MKLPKKFNFKKVVVAAFGFLMISFLGLHLADMLFVEKKPIEQIGLGVSFSPQYAKSLGLDYKQVFEASVNDLGVKNFRVMTYWDQSESQEGKFNYSETDYVISKAKENNLNILLVVGVKQPRWPECYIPKWVLPLDKDKREEKALIYLENTVKRYKNEEVIWGYQVENEPFVDFGEPCISGSVEFLEKEVSLVRRLDPEKPIVITDSGEAGLPITVMRLSDIFGTTVYKKVHNELFGYFEYPYPALYYKLKSYITRNLFAPNNDETILAELQTEPWAKTSLISTPIDMQTEIFSTDDFKRHIEISQKIGFSKTYLWGVEWWYFMKVYNRPEYWDFAKTLFQPHQ